MPSDWQNTFRPETWVNSVLSSPDTAINASLTHHKSIIVQQPAVGVLDIEPLSKTDQSLVISCGIHGNETAPIELVNILTEDILSGILPVNSRILIVLGHPPAIVAGQRFLGTNLNRLFGDANPGKPGYEEQRAGELKTIVSNFFSRDQTSKKHISGNSASTNTPARYHLDLHTAIRPSEFEKFAISPHGQTLDGAALNLLSSAGIEAVLESHQPASTFSYFSANRARATSFTLELGKVAPFGANDLSKLDALDALIRTIIQNQPIQPVADPPVLYSVVKELLRTSDQHQLLVDDQTPNFTAYPANTLIARDADVEYRTQHPDERIVFPNPNVPVGQRVGLMIVSKMKVSPFFHA